MGLGLGEVVVCLGFTAALFGTKDVPKVARAVGVLTGKAAGYLFRARSSAFKYAQEAQLIELHQEVTSGVRQLQNIQQEVRSGVNFFSNPVAFAASSLANRQGPGSAPGSPQNAAQTSAAQGTHHSQQSTPHRQPLASAQPSLRQVAWPVAGNFASAQPPGAPWPTSTSRSPSTAPQPGGSSTPSALPDGTPIIPVSAVAAGRAPVWTDKVPSGADVMLDSLMEQQVALQAQAFLSGQSGGPPAGTPPDQPRGDKDKTQ